MRKETEFFIYLIEKYAEYRKETGWQIKALPVDAVASNPPYSQE